MVATEIVVALVAVFSQSSPAMLRCGVVMNPMLAASHGTYGIEQPITGMPDEIECAEQALRRGDGSDLASPKASRMASAKASAQASPMGPPEWFARCWNDKPHSLRRVDPDCPDCWRGRRTVEQFLWAVGCDEHTCWGLSHHGEQLALPLNKCVVVAPVDRSGCLTVGADCPPEPELGWPVRFVQPEVP